MIIINKKIFFLIITLAILFKITNVKAATFYEAEYIDNIYMSKYDKSSQTIYYQKAGFFRNTETNIHAYCIEPFTFFTDSGAQYESTLTPRNLSEETLKKISEIAYFGYGYLDRNDPKWYAITQLMIWKEVDKNNDFYFTDGPNGTRINPYKTEIMLIENDINIYESVPQIDPIYYIPKNTEYIISVPNFESTLSLKSDNENVNISTGKIKIEPLPEGEYTINFTKNWDDPNKPAIFYQSPTSQSLMEVGRPNSFDFSIKVVITNPTIEIIKEDIITGKSPQGEASLDGTIISLYNDKNELIDEFEIENNHVTIDGLDYGIYYIYESEAGEGYEINPDSYKIVLNEDNNKEILVIKNQVIQKEIKIIKEYGTEESLKKEENVEFEIYDYEDNLVDVIVTDENGEASIILPYGKYRIIQVNSKDGYRMIDPFTVEVLDTEQELIELKDYKIPVPDTSASLIETLIRFILFLLC